MYVCRHVAAPVRAASLRVKKDGMKWTWRRGRAPNSPLWVREEVRVVNMKGEGRARGLACRAPRVETHLLVLELEGECAAGPQVRSGKLS